MRASGERIISYAVAVMFAAGGLAASALLVRPLAGPFFMFQFAAVVGAALHGGLGPGLLTMTLSAVGSYLLFFAPTLERYEAYRLLSIVVVSFFFASFAARMRRARASAEDARARAEVAEAKARAIGAQQERLVAVVSHDLRNPLNAIVLTAEHLRLDAADRQTKRLSRIVASALRMQAMIRDLLDYARARHESGLPLQREPLRLGDVCRVALEEIRAAAPGRTILIDVTGDDSAVLDRGRVEQVVSNLVTNALKHGAVDAPVTVKITEDGSGVRLDVTNQGLPIPPHLLPTLFEPFQAGSTAGSVGLGLFIVREIARGHGGRVSACSDESGTTFTVVFPRSSIDAANAA